MVEETRAFPKRAATENPQIPSGEIPVYITQSNFFRVIHVDGFFGGGTPTPGNIMMTVFSHHVPFPVKMINDENGVEIPSKREAKYGIEQHYEASLVLNINTAKAMIAWLNSTINNVENLMQQVDQKNK